MNAPDTTQLLAGAPMSALGVAAIRARETTRTDRLYDDPWAQAFVDAASTDFLAPDVPAGSADTWARFEALAANFYDGRTVGVRMADDRVRDWLAAGCRQVVDLGAGLDTRAFRLRLPPELPWFEIDHPATFAFKEPVLERAGAEAVCRRHVIAADLSDDWATALTAAGFRPDIPTAWVAEGLGLPRDTAVTVATTVTDLSAPGSRYATERLTIPADERRNLENLVHGTEGPPTTARGLPDAERWLADRGWRTEFRAWDEVAAALPRPVTTGNPDIGVVVAVRVPAS